MPNLENTNPLNVEPDQLHGILVVDKPPGPTTFDVIRFLRKTCNLPRKLKIGHLGTLDPFASGVVLVAFGKALKYASFALHLTKTYRARLWLGDETDTLDPTGKVIKTAPLPQNWQDKITQSINAMRGDIIQIPPAFSAKHTHGSRAYELARQGKNVELKPIRVTIYKIEIIGFGDSWLDFTAEVSSGTYMRSLARDLASSIGTVGHLVGLERTAVGSFNSDLSIPFSAFEVGGINTLIHHLKPIDALIEHLPYIVLKHGRENKILTGLKLTPKDLEHPFPPPNATIFKVLDPSGNFLSLAKKTKKENSMIPFKPWIE